MLGQPPAMSSTARSDHPVVQVEPPKLSAVVAQQRVALQTAANALNESILAKKTIDRAMRNHPEPGEEDGTSGNPLSSAQGMSFKEALELQHRWKAEYADLLGLSKELGNRSSILKDLLAVDLKELGASGSGTRLANHALQLEQVARELDNAKVSLRERWEGLSHLPERLEQMFLNEDGFEDRVSLSREIRTAQRELNAARGFLGIRGFFARDEVDKSAARLSALQEIESARASIVGESRFFSGSGRETHVLDPLAGVVIDTYVFNPLAGVIVAHLESLPTALRIDESRIQDNLEPSPNDVDERRLERGPNRVLADIVFQAAEVELQKNKIHGVFHSSTDLERFIREYLVPRSRDADGWELCQAHSNLGSFETIALARVCGNSRTTILPSTASCLRWVSIGRELREVEKAVAALGDLMGMSSTKEWEHLRGRPMHVKASPYGVPFGWNVSAALCKVMEDFEGACPSQRSDFELWHTLIQSREFESLSRVAFGQREGDEVVITQALIKHAKDHLAKKVLDTLLVSEEHQDKTVQLGFRLCRLGHEDTLPFQVLNAFREPGYSGETPFLHGSKEMPSELVLLAQSLSEEVMSALKVSTPSALYHSLILLRKHGQLAVQYSVVDHNEQWSRNPINESLEKHLEHLALHYLKDGAPREQQFVVAVFKRINQKLDSETLAALAEALARTQCSGGLSELIRFVCTRGTSGFADEISPLMSAAALSALSGSSLSNWEKSKFSEQLFFGLPAELQASQDIAESVALLFRQKPAVVMNAGACLQRLKELGIIEDKGLLPSPGRTSITQSVKKVDLSNLLCLAAVPGLVKSVERTCFSPERVESESIALGRLMIHIVLSAKHSLELSDNEFGCFCEVLVGVSETHNFRAVLAETNLQSQAQSFDIFERIGGVLLEVAPRTASFISCQEWLRLKPEETFHALHALSRLTSVPVLSFLEPGIFPLLTQLFPNHKDVPVLITQGVQTLEAVKWFLPENLPTLVEMIPLFLKQGASSGDAWSSHEANLQRATAPFLNETGLSIKEEMQSLLEFQRHFPALHAPMLYKAFRAIGRPEREHDLKALGLTHTDARVIHELKTRTSGMRNKILTSEGPIDLRHEIDQELLSSLIGHTGGFGDLASPIRSFNESYGRRQITPLDSRLQDKEFFVDSIDIEKVQAFGFSEPTRVRYEMFRRELRSIQGRSLKGVLSSEHSVVQGLLAEEQGKLQGVLRTSGVLSPGEKRGRESELKRIEDVLARIENSSSLAGFVTALCDYKSKESVVATPSIRRLALRMALDELSGEDAFFASLEREPTKVGLEAIVALVNTNFKNEALSKEPFNALTEKQRMSIQLALGTASFKEDFKRLDQIGVAGREKIVAHPTRGILGELSGYNCSACWTREQGIMARYSNMTALMYIRNPDDEARRKLVGGCLLLKVKATTGEDVLVIRGINPTQNFITNLKPESFFERFVDDAVVPMARSLGVSLIVIPNDGISGGAKTNRPTLGMYISEKYRQNPVVPLDPYGPTSTFNGYQINAQCVLVRRLA